jgi:hypothetical protein
MRRLPHGDQRINGNGVLALCKPHWCAIARRDVRCLGGRL